EDTGALSVRAAVACLVFVFAGLIISIALANRISILRMAPVPDPPEVLARKARDLANKFGYTDAPADSAYRFEQDTIYARWANQNINPGARRTHLARNQPPEVLFWYRQAPQALIPIGPGDVTHADPPAAVAGDLQIRLDTQGRLAGFEAVG